MKRMSEYGTALEKPPSIEQRLAEKEERELQKQEQLEAERRFIHLAKLVAADSFDAARELIPLVREMAAAGQLKDPARTMKDLATTGAIMFDKALLAEGRPTHIHQTNAEDLWAKVGRMMGYVEGTAVDVEEPPRLGEGSGASGAS